MAADVLCRKSMLDVGCGLSVVECRDPPLPQRWANDLYPPALPLVTPRPLPHGGSTLNHGSRLHALNMASRVPRAINWTSTVGGEAAYVAVYWASTWAESRSLRANSRYCWLGLGAGVFIWCGFSSGCLSAVSGLVHISLVGKPAARVGETAWLMGSARGAVRKVRRSRTAVTMVEDEVGGSSVSVTTARHPSRLGNSTGITTRVDPALRSA